ncbi:TPA: hypothetical protein ACKJ9M_001935 [Neisseria gonorrhoeae]
MQADLAYAYEHITRDYPEATGANQGKISTVSDYFKNIRTRSVHPRLALGYDFGGWRIFSAPAVAAGLHQSLQYYRSRHCRRFRQIHQFRRITPIPQKPWCGGLKPALQPSLCTPLRARHYATS